MNEFGNRGSKFFSGGGSRKLAAATAKGKEGCHLDLARGIEERAVKNKAPWIHAKDGANSSSFLRRESGLSRHVASPFRSVGKRGGRRED